MVREQRTPADAGTGKTKPRTAKSDKYTFDPSAVAFQQFRNSVCAALQIQARRFGTVVKHAQEIEACELHIFRHIFQNVPAERIAASSNCNTYYKHIVFVLLSAPPDIFCEFVCNKAVRPRILDRIRQHLIWPQTYTAFDQPVQKAQATDDDLSGDAKTRELEGQLQSEFSDGTANVFLPVCRDCRTNKYVVQDNKGGKRSADEGLGIDYYCEKCHKEWHEAS